MKAPHAPNRGERRPAPWWAKWAVAIAAPVLVLALLESGLRLGGFGHDANFFIPDQMPGVFRTNPRYTELFFPASFGLKPLNFRIVKAKPADTFRVFLLGESAAMGVPEPAFAIAPQLDAQLRAAYPAKKIEVFNLGITAINSHTSRDIAEQAVEFEPDLLVVYMGNNEVVGPFGPSSAVANRMPSRGVIQLSLRVRKTRLGQLLQHAIQGLVARGHDFKDWRGMEMFAGKNVAADDPRMEAVYSNFSSNLQDILALAQRHRVKVVLSTVAVNLRDCAPFASLHRRDLAPALRETCERDLEEATKAVALGRNDQAQALLEEAVKADLAFAETHFQLARVLEHTGEPEKARHEYLEARQWDALRFRADERINQIIREAAAAKKAPGISLVDVARELGAAADSSVPAAGHRFFFEHVHLTWEGNYALVQVLAPAAGSALFGASQVPGRWLTSQECADELGFTELGRASLFNRMDELTARPPFTSQSSFAADRSWLKRELERASASATKRDYVQTVATQIEDARQRNPGSGFLIFQAAVAESELGHFAHALALNDQLATVQPPSAEAAAQRAFILQGLGRRAEAEAVLLASAEAEPYYFQTYALLAQLWSATGELNKALDYFSKLVARMPESRGARHPYAEALMAHHDVAGAEAQWRAILRMVPDDEGALRPLLRVLGERGKTDEALELMLAAFAYNPRNYRNNEMLVAMYDARGDLANMTTYMRALADSGPVNPQLYVDLAAALEKLGRHDEANFVRLKTTSAVSPDTRRP
jgi:tetratricopeptide (TPR) repeat protein